MPYTTPTAAELALRFSAFAAVDSGTVDYWITDALLIVKLPWIEADYQPGIMELAAHNMAQNGIGASGGAVASLADMGVTSFKSGNMSVSFAEDAVSAKSDDGYSSTKYGVMFKKRLRRNRGGPITVTGTAAVCS